MKEGQEEGGKKVLLQKFYISAISLDLQNAKVVARTMVYINTNSANMGIATALYIELLGLDIGCLSRISRLKWRHERSLRHLPFQAWGDSQL